MTQSANNEVKVEVATTQEPIQPIVYDLPEDKQKASSKIDHLITTTQEKYQKRAQRFGGKIDRKVTDVDVIGAKRAVVRDGFITGFDITSTEEMQRRARRAKRFSSDKSIESTSQPTTTSNENLPTTWDKSQVKIDPLERRRDPSLGELPRDDVIHIFGVDDMSTEDVLNHFKAYGPSWCEWLNDSTCNIAFEDEHTMNRALNGMKKAAKETGIESIVGEEPVVKMDDSQGAGCTRTEESEKALPKNLVWQVALPFMKGNKLIPLWIRQATFQDKRPDLPNPKSKWSRTVMQKRRQSVMERNEKPRRKKSGEIKNYENNMGNEDGEMARKSKQGIDLGVRLDKQAAITKARWKRVTKMDLDKPLSS